MKGERPATPSGGAAAQGETERLPSPSPAAEPQTPGLLQPGQVLADRYVVAERIGKGAGSLVYRAFDRGLQEWIAIKVLDAERWAGATIPEPLFRELRHAREIQHPHVCRIYDVVRAEAGGPQFLTMALAEGGSLRDTLAREPERALSKRLADVQGVLSGLAALHAAGIIHRDVKPENVLRMRDGRVVLSDFGLAVAPDRATHVTGGVGTPVYMAPELRLGAPADARSDVWSLGLLMQETVFGVRTPPEALPAASSLTATERRLRDRLKALCAWCLHVEPDQRPADACQVLERFQRLGRRRWLPLEGPGQRPALWGLAAVVALVGAGLALRPRLASNPTDAVIEVPVEGTPRPLGDNVRTLLELDGRVHCVVPLRDGSLGLIWGDPRRAERLDPGTGARTVWDVPPASYQLPPTDFPDPLDNNCPQLDADGKRLLYWGEGAGKQRAVFLQEDPGAAPTMLTAGSMPVWHPNGQMLALRVDDQHPGVFNLATRHLTVLPKPREHRALMLVQLAFDADGRHLLVRSVDAAGGYAIGRYDLDRFRPGQGILARPAAAGTDQILRLTMGATRPGELLVHAMLPSGAYGIAGLQWTGPRLRWLAEWQPLDLTTSVITAGPNLTVVARRWTTELQALRDGLPVRTVISETPVTVADATPAGDVVVQTDRAGKIVVVLYPAGASQPHLLGAGPLDSVPQFTSDGRSVLFGRTDRARGQDSFMLCGFEGNCRSLGAMPSIDFPALAPDGQRVAYIAWSPYPHTALFDVASRTSRILTASLPCTPRWLGDNVWVAQGSGGVFTWAEHQAATGRATGRRVPGKGSCGAAGPGPDGVLQQRLRIVQRERSRLLALPGGLPAP